MDQNKLKYLPTFAELCDFLSIKILKSIFLPANKKQYEEEIRQVISDIDCHIQDKDIKLNGKLIRALMILQLSNRYIWELESRARAGEDQDYSLLQISHKTNGIRNSAKNAISNELGERIDLKVDSTCNQLNVNDKMDWSNLFFELDGEYINPKKIKA